MAADPTTASGIPAVRWHDLVAGLPTPAFVYDLDAIARTVGLLRRDAAVFGDPILCFAVKANRCPDVLRQLAALGVGADVASLPELEAATKAGLKPIFATGPAFGPAELRALSDRGVVPDLDSLSQLRSWRAELPERRQIGLRIRLPLLSGPGRGGGRNAWSRFGVDPLDPLVEAELVRGELDVVQLHVHAGELGAAEEMERVGEVLVECARAFEQVTTVNLGGGFEYLRADYAASLEAWGRLAPELADLRVVLEPGRLMMAGAGYLVVTARGAERRDGKRIVTVDASAWNLMPWFRPRVVAALPAREGTPVPHAIAGCTCYEQDYFAQDELLPRVAVGDRLVLDAAGAYSGSLARHTHGLPTPGEWLLERGRLRPAEPEA
jgi:diaminopimelate decarboxylase